MSERIYASDGRFIGVTGDEKDARIAELEATIEQLTAEKFHYLHKCHYCNVEMPWTDGTDTEYWCQCCGREQPATWTEVRWVAEDWAERGGE